MDKDQINKLIQFGTYGGELLKGKLIETHISWVILTKRYAFKIKKKMQYSFLNFSSISKRKYYCEQELLLNSRLSDIYLDVLPVKQRINKLFIGEGKGQVIGYAVRMKKLQIAKQMNYKLERKQVSEIQINVLANKIALFHRDTDIIYNPFNESQAKTEFNDILTVIDWVKVNLTNRYADFIEKAVRNSNTFLDQNKKFLKDRIKSGFWRDGHGDLHAKNIFLYRDPIIFDCIEFNDAFRQIDVLNEVAFFCMDLEAFQRTDLSKQFMKTYLKLFPCMKGKKEERLFNYYKCYRANVRAKVNCLRAMQTDDTDELTEYLMEIKKYLLLMDYYNERWHVET